MAGDWLKVEKSTPRKPEVLRISMLMQIHPDQAFGLCFRFWAWCDDQLRDGCAEGVTEVLIDAVIGFNGFASALLQVGWLQVRSGSLVIPHFDRHLTESAKTRALSSKRMQKSRDQKTQQPQQVLRDERNANRESVAQDAPPEKRREQNRREEKNLKPPPSKPNVDHEPKASTDPVSVTWGLVAERLKKAGLAKVSFAVEKAKDGGFKPEQISEWLDYLATRPGIGPGAILERILQEDALWWTADFGWPPTEEPSSSTVEVRYQNQTMTDRDKKDLESLNEKFGTQLDGMNDNEVIKLAGPMRDPIDAKAARKDPQWRLWLLRRMKPKPEPLKLESK